MSPNTLTKFSLKSHYRYSSLLRAGFLFVSLNRFWEKKLLSMAVTINQYLLRAASSPRHSPSPARPYRDLQKNLVYSAWLSCLYYLMALWRRTHRRLSVGVEVNFICGEDFTCANLGLMNPQLDIKFQEKNNNCEVNYAAYKLQAVKTLLLSYLYKSIFIQCCFTHSLLLFIFLFLNIMLLLMRK